MDLVGVLENAGVERVQDRGDEVHGRCPNPDHDDHKPSWSINSNTLLHFCFSCGYSGTLEMLVRDLTGSVPEDLSEQILTTSFLRKVTEIREQPPGETMEAPVLDDWAIQNLLKEVPRPLRELRYLNREPLNDYEVRWNPDTKQWVLPVRDIHGKLRGAQYRQSGGVLTLGFEKSKHLFGIGQARPFDQAAIVESPLDAVRLWQIGVPAVSSLGAYVSQEQMTLLARNFTSVLMALDDDEAGWKATEIVSHGLRKRGCQPIQWDYTGLRDERGRKAKDVGDVVDDDALKAAYQRTIRMGF